MQSGTGVGAQFGKPLAGKTGTTEDFGDAWFIGYTPRLTAAVWMGYPQGASAKKLMNIHGVHGGVQGGSLPAAIFKRFMAAVEKGRTDGDFAAVTSFGGKVLKPPSSVKLVTTTTSTSSTSTTSTSAPAGSTTTSAKPSTTTTSTKASTTTTTSKPAGPSP